jgi:hypothetical protein
MLSYYAYTDFKTSSYRSTPNVQSHLTRKQLLPDQINGSTGQSQPTSSPGTTQKWKSWDAKKADRALAQTRLAQDAAAPKRDQSMLVYNETYRKTVVKDGIRTKGQTVYNVIRGNAVPCTESQLPVQVSQAKLLPSSCIKTQTPLQQVQYPDDKLTPLHGILNRPSYPQAKLTPLPSVVTTVSRSRSESTPTADANILDSTATLLTTKVITAEDDPFGLGFGSMTIYPVIGETSPQSAAKSTSNLTEDLLDFDLNHTTEEHHAADSATEDDLLIQF